MSFSLLLVAATAAFPHAPQDQDRSPAALLPASTIAFVEFAGLDACVRAASEAPLLALAEKLGERALGARPADLFAAEVLRDLTDELRQTGLGTRELRAVLRSRSALGVGRPVAFDDGMLPSFGLVLELGDDSEALGAAIDRFVGAMDEREVITTRTRTIGGVEVNVLSHERRSGEVCIAKVDGYAIATLGAGYLTDILGTMRGETESILSTPIAERARQDVGDGALAWGAVNLRPIADLVRWYAPYEADAILAALGVRALDGFSFGTAMRGGQSIDVFRVAGEIDEHGILAAIGGSRVDPSLLNSLPEDSALVCGLTIDLEKLRAGIHELVAALPADARRELRQDFDREFAGELRDAGIEPAEVFAFVEALGPELVLGVTTPRFQLGVPQFPRLVLVGRAPQGTDPAEQFAALATRVGAVVQEQVVEERTLRWITIEGAPVRASIAFATDDDKLVVASDLPYLKELLRQEQGLEVDPSAAGDGCVEQASFWMWLRVREHIGALWEETSPLVDNLLESNEQIPIAPEDLPSPEELHAALRDVSIGVGIDGGGFVLRFASPIGGSTFLAVFGALFDEAVTGSRRRTG